MRFGRSYPLRRPKPAYTRPQLSGSDLPTAHGRPSMLPGAAPQPATSLRAKSFGIPESAAVFPEAIPRPAEGARRAWTNLLLRLPAKQPAAVVPGPRPDAPLAPVPPPARATDENCRQLSDRQPPIR